MDLAVDDHRIDDPAAVFGDHVFVDLHEAGRGIDLHRGDVGGGGGRAVDRVVGVARAQFLARLDRQRLHVGIDRLRDLLEGHGAVRADDGRLPAGKLDVVVAGLEQMRGDALDLVPQQRRGVLGRAAAEHRAAARIGAGRHRHRIAVALDDTDILKACAEIVGDDLRQRGFQPLAVGGDAEGRGDGAGRVDRRFLPFPNRC